VKKEKVSEEPDQTVEKKRHNSSQQPNAGGQKGHQGHAKLRWGRQAVYIELDAVGWGPVFLIEHRHPSFIPYFS
jgi:hypothetical protein